MKNTFPITVREKTDNGIEHWDIYSRLAEDRIIYIDQQVDMRLSSIIVSELLFLDSKNDQDITLYIDSPGGSVTAGLAIYDTMQTIKSDVKTVGVGLCASMGAFLLSSGTKGKRFVTPSTRVMIHMVSSGTEGTVADQEIALNESKFLNEYLHERMGVHCGKKKKDMLELTQRDKWLSGEEAKKIGLIDGVISFGKKKW